MAKPRFYEYHRLTPDTFRALLAGAEMTLGDYRYLTGRRQEQVLKFLDDKGDWSPPLIDAVLLELCRDKDTRLDALDIVDRYLVDPTKRRYRDES